MVMDALEIARESLARQAEADGAKHTAAGYRAGRYDEEGLTPAARRAAELALEQNERGIGELAVLAAEYLFRRDQYRDRDSSTNLDNMSFAEDRLREHPLVAKQLSFYVEKTDDA
jgi:hypothetical protein